MTSTEALHTSWSTRGNSFLSGATNSPNFPDSYGVFPASTGFLAEVSLGPKGIAYSMRLP